VDIYHDVAMISVIKEVAKPALLIPGPIAIAAIETFGMISSLLGLAEAADGHVSFSQTLAP
jgi:hypothetical protein